jgi:Ser/Thr protein kinase RdoA (MazF antagonist)
MIRGGRSKMNTAEQEALCRHYRLGRPERCQPAGGTRNDNCLLHTSRGAWFVRRRYDGYSAPARVAFDHRALQFLSASDVPVAAPLRSPGGDTFWMQGDRVWEVFPALAGRQLRDGDEADVRLLAEALTRLHRAAREFGERFDKLGPRGETDPAHLLSTVRTMRQRAPECAEALCRYDHWAAGAARDLDDDAFSALPHTLVHGDVQPANVLVDGGRVSFVDFDWCAWRPRVYDLAFAVLLCCSTRAAPVCGDDIWSISQPVRVQPELLRCFLAGCANAGWPVSDAERRALRPQVLLSWCSCRLAGALKAEPSQWNDFLSRPPHDPEELFPPVGFDR